MFNALKSKVFFWFLTINLFVIPNQTVYSISHINKACPKEEVKSKSLLVLVNRIEDIKKVRNIIYKSSDYIFDIQTTKEAKLIKVTLTNETEAKKLICYMKGKHPEYIQALGYEKTILNTIQIKKDLYQTPYYNQLISKSASKNKFYNYQWDNHAVTNNGQSYKIQKGNHNVSVAIIDSGIDFNHPDLKKNILNKGKSFVPYTEDTQDYLGHGTMVAGVIASNGDLLGVGPELGIVPYKVFQENSADSSWIIDAIIQAAKDNIDVINLSLSTYLSKSDKNDRVLIKAFQNALLFAKQQGSIVVASAGNDSLNLINPTIAIQRGDLNDYQYHFPGGNKDVITVSSTTKEKNLASYSNYGNISFAAPGGDYGPYFNDLQEFDISSWIVVNSPTNLPQTTLSKNLGLPKGYELDVGSSLAAPKVSALTALLIAEYEEKHNKKPSRSLLINLLKKGALDLGTKGFDSQFGYGEINVVESLNSVN